LVTDDSDIVIEGLLDAIVAAIRGKLDNWTRVEVEVECDPKFRKWRLRISIVGEIFRGIEPTKRASMIINCLKGVLEPLYKHFTVRDAMFLYFGLTPDQAPVPAFPPLGEVWRRSADAT